MKGHGFVLAAAVVAWSCNRRVPAPLTFDDESLVSRWLGAPSLDAADPSRRQVAETEAGEEAPPGQPPLPPLADAEDEPSSDGPAGATEATGDDPDEDDASDGATDWTVASSVELLQQEEDRVVLDWAVADARRAFLREALTTTAGRDAIWEALVPDPVEVDEDALYETWDERLSTWKYGVGFLARTGETVLGTVACDRNSTRSLRFVVGAVEPWPGPSPISRREAERRAPPAPAVSSNSVRLKPGGRIHRALVRVHRVGDLSFLSSSTCTRSDEEDVVPRASRGEDSGRLAEEPGTEPAPDEGESEDDGEEDYEQLDGVSCTLRVFVRVEGTPSGALVPWRRRGEPRLPVASRRSPAASHGPDDRIGAAPQAPPALGGP